MSSYALVAEVCEISSAVITFRFLPLVGTPLDAQPIANAIIARTAKRREYVMTSPWSEGRPAEGANANEVFWTECRRPARAGDQSARRGCLTARRCALVSERRPLPPSPSRPRQSLVGPLRAEPL